MKVNIGSKLALYPMPLVVIGTLQNDKPTWTLVAHTGIIGHDRILISLFQKHFINNAIKESKKCSINIVNQDILVKADYCGIVSGQKVDKSLVFDYTISSNNIPLINESSLSMECLVESNLELSNFDNFICSILATHVEENCLSNNKIDYSKISPILFDMPNYNYYKLGETIGKGATFGKAYEKDKSSNK